MEIPRLNVTVHPIYFQGAIEGSAEYQQRLTIAKDFAEYWRKGYSPDFGRDRHLNGQMVFKNQAYAKFMFYWLNLLEQNKIFGILKVHVI